MKRKIRIGALVSGGGSNLQAIMDACGSGTIQGEVVFVGADNPGAGGLARAERAGIPTIVTDYAALMRQFRENPEGISPPADLDLDDVIAKQSLFPPGDEARVRNFFLRRAMAEASLLKKMAAYPFDLLVLAGFMRTLSPYFLDRVNTDPARPVVMNIHPALLPSFPGIDGYGDTYRYGCRVGGCTVHFVDYGEDTGPIIGQRAFAIEPGDTLEQVKKKGLSQEWELYPECVRLFSEGRLELVQTEGRRIVAIG